MQKITEIIRNRRSVQPTQFTGEPVDREALKEALINASWAPSHGKIEPWRFVVIEGEAKNKLIEYCGQTYDKYVPIEKQDPFKKGRILKKIESSEAVVALIFHRDPNEKFPEWEDLSAFAMAVQNFWLSIHASGMAGYWASPKMYLDHFNDYYPLSSNQKCRGFFFLGNPQDIEFKAERQPLDEVVTWLS